eukprot:COSAG02_NODE_118_length_35376_cov_20.294923_26_plen_75_part_00
MATQGRAIVAVRVMAVATRQIKTAVFYTVYSVRASTFISSILPALAGCQSHARKLRSEATAVQHNLYAAKIVPV